jgi:hypothetical protein
MYQTINFSQFVDAFVSMGRQSNFATHYENGEHVGWYDGLRVLFDYIEDSTDGTYELDVIGLCCDFSHDTALEIAASYGMACINDRDMTHDEIEEAVRDYLNDTGRLIGETGYGFVYRQH